MPPAEEPEEGSLSKLLFDFGLGTTSHGIPRIFGAKSPVARLAWLLLVITAFSFFIWQASILVIQYLDYDVVVTVTVDNVNGLAQDFPAVTICNTNRVMKSKVKKSNQFKLADIDRLTTLRYYAPCLHGDSQCKGGGLCYKSFRKCNGIHDCEGGDDEINCNYAPCRGNEFTCKSGSRTGRCIPIDKKCDRIRDCYQGEDEDCEAHEVKCTADEFRCEKGITARFVHFAIAKYGTEYCIPIGSVCDGRTQCADESDEMNCVCTPSIEFTCYDLGGVICIPRSNTCDGKNDCYDGSDESVPCSARCDNGRQTIHAQQRCDTLLDCTDGTDEANCDWDKENPCRTDTKWATAAQEWRCSNGECVLNSSRCDRSRDCRDGSDELECECGEPDFYICNNGECVDKYARCNGVADCINSEDESDCGPIVLERIRNKTSLSWNNSWNQQFIQILDDPEVYKKFKYSNYKNWGFQRVEGESPPDWLQFMTFSSTPDNADLADVLKLNKEETAALGHDGNKFIQQCSYDQNHCSASEFYPFQHDKYGNCYTFNSGKTHNLDESFMEVTNRSSGFYQNDGRILRTNRPGVQYGLKLTLFVEQKEFIGIFGQDVGVKVVIHPRNLAPFPEDTAITASVGQLTSVAVKKRVINRQSYPYGNCTDEVDGTDVAAQMYPDYGYSVQACLKSCVQDNMRKYCGCVATLLVDGTPRCKLLDEEQERCRQLIVHFAQGNLLNCSCPPACSEITYDKIVSQSSWPSQSYLNRLLYSIWEKQEEHRQVVYDRETVRDNLVRLEIFFEDLSYVNVAEHPAYKIPHLLGDIGGTLGLYIGLSVITIFEFGEFLVCACRICLNRLTYHMNKNKVQVIKNKY